MTAVIAPDPFGFAADLLDPPIPDVGHHYEARGVLAEIQDARDAELLISGPAGTGKSRAALEKVHHLALKHPGLQALVVRKTRVSLGSSALKTWRRFVIPEAKAAGLVRWYGGSAEEPPQYRYRNGSAVVVGGMDKATKIMSTEYDIVFAQEAIELTEDDWEAITTRLRSGVLPYQQLLADTNPSTPTHWLKARGDRGQTRFVESRHEDNPVLFTPTGELTAVGRAYISKLDALTGVRFQRLRRGLWVAAEGIIYEDWDPAVHLVDRFPIPASWPRYLTVDFGYTNPFVCQWWAEDPDGRVFRYREIYHTRRTVDEHAAVIVAHSKGEPTPAAFICDHDAEGRAVLERETGMATVPAHKAVTEGIQAVQARMKPAGDGRPRMFFLRDSVVEVDQALLDAAKPTSTEEEIPGYVWQPVPPGSDKPPKEDPLKVDDHGCDAARYLVADRDLGGGPATIRWLE